jgi:hypothetical protein
MQNHKEQIWMYLEYITALLFERYFYIMPISILCDDRMMTGSNLLQATFLAPKWRWWRGGGGETEREREEDNLDYELNVRNLNKQ